MSVKKQAQVIYVPFIPKERSGIGRDVPAHVKLEWRHEDGRKHVMELPLSEDAIKAISLLPDVPQVRGIPKDVVMFDDAQDFDEEE